MRIIVLLSALVLLTSALAADAPPPIPNHPLPKKVGLWSVTHLEQVAPERTAFPEGAPIKPMTLAGPRAGLASGQVVVAGPAPLADVSATVDKLIGPGGATLAGATLEIRYGTMRPDAEAARL